MKYHRHCYQSLSLLSADYIQFNQITIKANMAPVIFQELFNKSTYSLFSYCQSVYV